MTAVRAKLPPGKKFCIACKELIPADATVCFHCRSIQRPEKQTFARTGLKWVAGITAIVGLITGLSGVVGPLKGWWAQGRQEKAMLAFGQKQVELGEYATALDTYSEILKMEPNNTAAMRSRLDAAMRWLEDFSVSGENDEEIARQARSIFGRITPILDAGLASGQGYRAADVVAHVGWLNLLRRTITYEEGGQIEENFQRALNMDPSNAYAHAMMGNWLLDNNRSLEEAVKHFDIALRNSQAKPFVRDCQLGAMIYNENPGVLAALIRVANDMRQHGESISEGHRGRIHSNYDPGFVTEEHLREVLTAVPPDEAWATYRWVDQPLKEWAPFNSVDQRFIQASLDEIAGKRENALQIFRQLQSETKTGDNTVARRIRAAVQRLSH